MKSLAANPESNSLPPGISAAQVAQAVERSGYPLQLIVREKLAAEFMVQEEWSYVDRDSKELRTLDLHAELPLSAEPAGVRVRPHLTLLIECKQSEMPHVFFLSEARGHYADYPKVFGLRSNELKITTDDEPSTWHTDVLQALSLEEDAFQVAAPACFTFSKCTRKGSDLELSGAEAYKAVILPLIKGMVHLDSAVAPPDTWQFFDARLVVALAVIDGSMIGARLDGSQTDLMLLPWVRVVRHEYESQREYFARDRRWVIDVVHKDFLTTYLSDHLIPFAKRFAERALRHTAELATGKAFVSHMTTAGASPLEERLGPEPPVPALQRGAAILRHALAAPFLPNDPGAKPSA